MFIYVWACTEKVIATMQIEPMVREPHGLAVAKARAALLGVDQETPVQHTFIVSRELEDDLIIKANGFTIEAGHLKFYGDSIVDTVAVLPPGSYDMVHREDVLQVHHTLKTEPDVDACGHPTHIRMNWGIPPDHPPHAVFRSAIRVVQETIVANAEGWVVKRYDVVNGWRWVYGHAIWPELKAPDEPDPLADRSKVTLREFHVYLQDFYWPRARKIKDAEQPAFDPDDWPSGLKVPEQPSPSDP